MAETTTPNQGNDPQDDQITLSAAILAPLNALFEVQVHAARAFLNFVLQMGFRHKYSKSERDALKKDKEENKEILDELAEEDKKKARIHELESRERLSEAERKELWQLRLEWDDLLMQKFDYFDDKGNVSTVFVPNLAILPIKPLAVDNATFKFEINVKSFTANYDQMGTVKGVPKDRPWFLIKPKRITGDFGRRKENENERSISIEVNVGTTDMPYGLDKLLTSLTNNIMITPRVDTDKTG